MSDPFFARPAKAGGGVKRKRNEPAKSLGASKGKGRAKPAVKPKRVREDDDEEIDEGGSGSDLGQGPQLDSVSEGEDDSETPAQKRLRLAKMYLENLEQSKQGELEHGCAFKVLTLHSIPQTDLVSMLKRLTKTL